MCFSAGESNLSIEFVSLLVALRVVSTLVVSPSYEVCDWALLVDHDTFLVLE